MILPTIDLSEQEKLSNAHSIDLIKSLNLLGEVILNIPTLADSSLVKKFLETHSIDSYWVYPIKEQEFLDNDSIIRLLDQGTEKIVIPSSNLLSLDFDYIPADRLAVSLDLSQTKDIDELVKKLTGSVSAYLINLSINSSTKSLPENLFQNLSNLTKLTQKDLSSGGKTKIGVVLSDIDSCDSPPIEIIQQLSEISADLVVHIERLTLDPTNDEGLINISKSLTCTLKTDRPDGLFTTIVADERGEALGIVYSSAESVQEALKTRTGVYQSRKRGLWHKGATSGAVQELNKIQVDCDADSLRFIVKQHGPGFCHLNTRTCFGNVKGLTALEQTLQSRKKSAPPGSYTAKLFQNPDLLHSKIMEEADELCSAKTKDEITWEAADLIYFTLVNCIANGVSLTDIESHLDKRSMKITRRPGNAKPKWDVNTINKENKQQESQVHTSPKNEVIKMQKFNLSGLSAAQRTSLLQRPIIKSDNILAKVRPIIDDVRKKGDAALIELTAKFDGVKLESPVISAPFPPEAMTLDESTRLAIDRAYDNIYKFHDAQYDRSTLVVETMPGVICSRFSRPIERVGLYIPGGTASLPSTALMLGIPAKVAGCKQIVFATPPRKDGTVVPEILYVAHKVGASKVVLAGGSQAVAALAYGTESVPKVDKICGPGNQYVTAAKMVTQNDSSAMISIDMPAGPSELLIIADNTSNPAYVASDLLSQAEHGEDSQVVLVAVSLTPENLAKIEHEVHIQASVLPRVSIVSQSIPKSFILQVNTLEEAVKFSNDYAPEHLILHLDKAESLLEKIENAGSVFVGSYSPESCGDYASGTNHTLPTYGYARMYSGVNTLTFLKHITSQQLTKEGLHKLGTTVMRLAEVEGLEAHRNAVHIRVKDIES
ncbi:histidinol dehydrogenase-domain-containing protein [Glomus cerebriforme]|uniref:Histidine biosynthesis trifunctional protein n=1 Tax=Glomus cerebriforme TaxID=658196 RepID=A0A397T0T1_9GLOM|nr:histidinol dehydrogenase-domain-containing protein [Glomus cerebriforme]